MSHKQDEEGGDDNWRRIDTAFQQALLQPPDSRVVWLNEHFADQPEICQAVSRLLQADKPSEALFESAQIERDRLIEEAIGPESDRQQAGALSGTRIGPYQLEALIATGGMGAVYRGQRTDGQYQQTVAIKILPVWAADAQTVARLRSERQIMAGLQHPSITRLLDGGETGDGFPFLVTEFIDGLPIDQYVEESSVSLERRLALFIKVAEAVQYAHQKLVIHRDIKPDNILVDLQGDPHLLDFGIAKLMEPDLYAMTLAKTVTGFTPMTPEYASPEQCAGEPVSTASDIYQLGLLLYLLLTGGRPTRQQITSSGSITRPSTVVLCAERTQQLPGNLAPQRLSRKLKGDLDTLVLKALREQPAQRYSSAAELAADVRRYMRGEAIEARPETLWSASRRLARHYPFASLMALSLVVLVFIWGISMFNYARDLEIQRDEAARQASRANQVKEVLVDIFRRTDPSQADTIGGKDASVWASLDAASNETRDQLSDEPDIQAELLTTLSTLYGFANEPEKAKKVLSEAIGIYARLGPGFQAELATNKAQYADLIGNNDYASGRALMLEALDYLPRLQVNDPEAAVKILLAAGILENFVGEFDNALTYFNEAELVLVSSELNNPSLLIEALTNKADLFIGQDRLDEAEPMLLEALQLVEQHFGPTHRRNAASLNALAVLQRRQGKFDQAIVNSHRLVNLIEQDSASTYFSLLSAKNNLAIAYGGAGFWPEEQEILREVVQIRRDLIGPEGNVNLAISIKNLASSLHLSGQYEDSLRLLDESEKLIQRHFPDDSSFQALSPFTRSLVFLDTGQPEQAEVQVLEAVGILEAALGDDHFQVHVSHCVLAEAYVAQGRIEAGRQLAEPAMAGMMASATKTQRYIDRCQQVLDRVGVISG